MTENNWTKWGEDMRKTVQDSVDSHDFSNLSRKISSIVESVEKHVEEGVHSAKKSFGPNTMHSSTGEYHKKSAEKTQAFKNVQQTSGIKQLPKIYGKTGGTMALGIISLVFGIIGITGFSLGTLTTTLLAVLGGELLRFGGILSTAILSVFLAGSIFLTVLGTKMIQLVSRFGRYRQIIGNKIHVSIEELAGKTSKKAEFIRKDLKKMIQKRFFLQGRLDEKETCLLVTDEANRLYIQAQQQYLLRQQLEKEKQMQQSDIPEHVRQIIAEGEEFIKKIRKSNDAIPGIEISRKISYMEHIVEKIFQRVKQKPELAGDLKKLMSYYLPMTIKLLEAYEELDAQPIQGTNITNAKKEIEETMDTLNIAFEKLLDNFYQDTAWDISSDISVLETMLAQEGLMKSDFDM